MCLITSKLYVICLLLMTFSVYADNNTKVFEIYFEKGKFYGPGKMPDAPMPKGNISHVVLDKLLNGKTEYFNNGANLPNIENYDKFPFAEKALLSNGTPFNEYMDGGVVDIGMGAMRLLNVVVANGPNQGIQHYRLDKKLNWNIKTDLALDPGYPQGLLIINNIDITTGLIWVPKSLQTQKNIPGGIDFAGSLPTGAPLVGKLGDVNMDGYLDGVIVGQSNIPLQHVFSPGAPAAQSRFFSSNIPVNAVDAVLFTLAGIENYKPVWDKVQFNNENRFLIKQWPNYFSDIKDRFMSVKRLSEKYALELCADIEVIDKIIIAITDAINVTNKNEFLTESVIEKTNNLFSEFNRLKIC